jgi:teichuronic acid exporter
LQFWIHSKWTPSFVFSISKFKEHLNFGYKITLSSILERVFNNLYIILIGRFFSASQVGFYTRADTMKNLPVSNLTMAMSKVTYPLFAEIQDDDIRLKRVYQKLMKMVVFVVTPVLIFSAILAEPIFRFLFTEKWLPSVPYFQILCFAGILYPLQAYNINVLNVKGRSDLSLKLVILNKILLVIGAGIGFQFGIYGLLYSQVALTAFSFFIYAHYTEKFINYSALEQFKDILPNLILIITPAILVFLFDEYIENYNDFLRFFLGISLGGITYIGLSYFFKFSSLFELQSLVLHRFKSDN